MTGSIRDRAARHGSAPEPLIEALIDAVRARFDATVIEDDGERETVAFKLPRVLTA